MARFLSSQVITFEKAAEILGLPITPMFIEVDNNRGLLTLMIPAVREVQPGAALPVEYIN